MSENSDFFNESQLKELLARWTIKWSRFAPKPKSSGEAAFIFDFTIPDTDFTLLSNTITKNETILTILKTQVVISNWQSRDNHSHTITYLKVIETDVDSLGNMFPDNIGYIIIKEK